MKVERMLNTIQMILRKISFDSLILSIIVIGTISFSAIYAFTGHVAFDEGFNLQVPVSIASKGLYATNYQYGRMFDPLITTGPTVLFPIGRMFKLFGVGLFQARVIILLYFVLFVCVMGYIVQRMSNSWGVVLTILLVSSLPYIFFFSL